MRSISAAPFISIWLPFEGVHSGNDDVNRSVQGFMAENPDDAQKAENLRVQAARCRRLARQTTDREIARRLVELAQESERRAVELEIGKHCI
jgi:hypothetical protein